MRQKIEMIVKIIVFFIQKLCEISSKCTSLEERMTKFCLSTTFVPVDNNVIVLCSDNLR